MNMARMHKRLGVAWLAVFFAMTGCNTTFLQFKGQDGNKPFSQPVDDGPRKNAPGPMRFADGDSPQTQPAADMQTDAADEETDAQLAQLTTTVRQYEARFPNFDDAGQPQVSPSLSEEKSEQTRKSSEPGPSRDKNEPLIVPDGLTPKSDKAAAEQVVENRAPVVPVAKDIADNAVTIMTDSANENGTSKAEAPAGPAPDNAITPNTSVTIETVASPQPPQLQEGTPTQKTNELAVELIDIRPATDNVSANEPQNPESRANQPIEANTTDANHPDVIGLITRLEKSVQQKPNQLDDQFKLRMLYLATDQL